MLEGGFNWELVISWMPEMWSGAFVTVYISFFALILGLLVGLIFSMFRISHLKVFRYFAIGYIYLIRGTPALIQILFIYFGMPFFGINVQPHLAGVIALGLNSGAYIAEMIRGGLASIPKGQMEAARSLGLSNSQAMRRIIIPQTFQIIIPPITGEYNKLIKGSSLLSVISIGELTRVGQRILGATFRPIEAWIPIAIIYFIMNYIVSKASKSFEDRLSVKCLK